MDVISQSLRFDRTVGLWPVATTHSGAVQVVATFNEGAWSVAFSPDSRFLSPLQGAAAQ